MLRIWAVIVLFGFLATGYTTWSHAHCGGWTRFPGFSPSLEWTGTECVGVTDGSYDIFQPSDQSIRQTEEVIHSQNQQAEQLHAAYPKRPYITLVDVQAFTSLTANADGLTPERESLEGFAVAQQRQLGSHGSTDPIVRVLIANAGQDMDQGVAVAQQLGNLTRSDHTVVGVVGLDVSSQPTVRTITALSNAGLPMVAASLSEDSLATDHPMYFQVAPRSTREAAVAAAWANQQLAAAPAIPRSVRVYYSADAADTYSTNLRDDAVASFSAQGFQVEARAFTPSLYLGSGESRNRGDKLVGTARAAGNDTCSYNGFVFFAGRGLLDYADFLNGAGQCGSTAIFLGDDDVSRYVADASERRAAQTPPFYYLSFALAPVTEPQGPELNFYTGLHTLFPFERNERQGRSLDGHNALSYDAAEVLITAVTYLREGSETIPVTPGTVWREITDIHTSRNQQVNKRIDGATGVIDFGGGIPRHVPRNKPVAILRVNNGEVDPNMVEICGAAAGHTSQTWCPPDP
jgi:ABC-type branched-subunit amino acid transport system substrate-binding protein